MMNDLRGPPSMPSYAGVPGANNGAMPPQFPPFPHEPAVRTPSSTHRSVQMFKRAGEGSFGMTLDQEANATAADCPRVSYVFPNSAASRAGVRSGWTIEFINNVSCRGRRVRDVAPIFRELQEVTLFVDVRSETAPSASTLPPLTGGINLTSPSTFTPRAPTPPALVWPPLPNVPAPSQGHSSSYASAGFPAPSTAAATTFTSPALLAAMHAAGMTGTALSTVVATSSSLIATTQPPIPRANVPTWQPLPVSAAIAHPRANASPTTQAQPTPLSVNGASPLHPPAASTGARAAASPAVSSVPPPVSTATPPRTTPATAPTLVVTARPTPVLSTSAPISNGATPAAAATARPATAAATATVASSPTQRAPATTSSTTAVAAATTPSTPATSRAAGKKRSRAQSESKPESRPATAATPPPTTTAITPAALATAAGGKKRRRQHKRRQSAPPTVSSVWDSDGAATFDDSDDLDVEEVSPPRAGSGSRRSSSRQAESGGRARRSLTVSRLMTMGFKQEDAELSVHNCGHDPDKCMLWIVSYLEEKQFMKDLNKASIESENQKRIDAQQQMKEESETLRQTTAFTSLFQTSYILSDLANAPHLQAMLASTIGEIAADTLVRTLLTKLLTVESKAIRWYKDASKCYMLALAARLETAFASHDAITCCSTLMATQPAAEACAFVRALHEEEQALTRALFFMPENQGGVPLAFLRADESMQFSLDDDGFEVVDQPPPPASPGTKTDE